MAGRVPSSCCAHAAAAATTASSSLSRRRALAAAHSSATSAALRSRHPTIITPHLLLRRRVATATARGSDHGRHRALSTATSPAAADGLAQRLMDEEMTRKEESDDAWRTGQVSNALTVLRRGGEGSSPAAHRLALQTLGSYITHLGPEDAVQMVRQALELGGLGQLAFAALEELRRMKGKEARRVLLREADALVSAACKAGRIQMAVRVVEEVQLELVRPSSKRRQRQRQRREEGEGPSLALGVGQEEEEAKEGKGKASFISRGAYLSLLRRLQQKGRPRSHCRLAESLLTHKGRPAAAALAGDAEATGLAAVVCWKAKRWRAVQRLLRVWEADGFCPLSQEEGPGPGRDDGAGAAADDGATLRRMEALFAALQREQQLEQGQRQVLTTEHGNMLLHARLRAGQRDAAAALAERMLQAGAAQSSSLLLPPANALSVCLVLEALGRAGDWDMCLQLLQGAKDRLQAMDKAGLAMVYKTAIAAAGKSGLWEGCLSLFYELHERGLPPDPGAYTALLKALRTAGRLDVLRSFLETMPTQHVTRERSAYNVLFAALGKAGCIDEALACFRRMEDEAGFAPGAYEYGTLIAACGGALDRQQAEGEGEEAETETEVARLVGTARGLLGEAERATILLRGGGRDGGMGNCYVQMLKVYGKAGRWGQARALLDEMRCAGVDPSFAHYYEAMRSAGFAGQKAAALEMLAEAAAAAPGGKPHVLCWNAAVLACSQAQDPDGCLALLDRMRGKGQEPGAINYARTASALARAGRVEEARVLLRAAAKRGGKGPLIQVDRAAYGALILACGERGDAAAAEAIMGVVEEMSKLGVAPDALTVAQAVSALARGCGRLAEAEALLRGSSSSSSGGGGKGRGAASLLAYHALMLAAVERKGGQGQQGAGAARRCEELLASMVETHGLCPTPVTRALVYQAGCGAKALAAVDACVLPSAGEGDEGREEEEEGKGEGAAVVSLEAARRSVERALALNPHDERRRTLHRALGAL